MGRSSTMTPERAALVVALARKMAGGDLADAEGLAVSMADLIESGDLAIEVVDGVALMTWKDGEPSEPIRLTA